MTLDQVFSDVCSEFNLLAGQVYGNAKDVCFGIRGNIELYMCYKYHHSPSGQKSTSGLLYVVYRYYVKPNRNKSPYSEDLGAYCEEWRSDDLNLLRSYLLSIDKDNSWDVVCEL